MTVKFTLECLKCGSSNVEIRYVDCGDHTFEFVCRNCGNWEESDE